MGRVPPVIFSKPCKHEHQVSGLQHLIGLEKNSFFVDSNNA